MTEPNGELAKGLTETECCGNFPEFTWNGSQPRVEGTMVWFQSPDGSQHGWPQITEHEAVRLAMFLIETPIHKTIDALRARAEQAEKMVVSLTNATRHGGGDASLACLMWVAMQGKKGWGSIAPSHVESLVHSRAALWRELQQAERAVEVLAKETHKRRLPWRCTYCGRLYAEYTNGCPACHFGEPGTGSSVRIDTDGIEAARIETQNNSVASAALARAGEVKS